MVTITGSTLKITAQPRVGAFQRAAPQELQFPSIGYLDAIGTVTLAPDASGPGLGWSVGFMQAQVAETSYAIYRGMEEKHGTVFEDRIGTGLQTVPCFDAVANGTPFIAPDPMTTAVAGSPAPLPYMTRAPSFLPATGATLSVGFRDYPSVVFLSVRTNPVTGLPNFLNEVRVQYDFVTVLAARDPAGTFRFLRGFTWSILWHQKVVVTPGGIVSATVPGGDRFTLGPVFEGPPDGTALGVFNGARATTCNLLGDNSQAHPLLRMVAGWPAYTPHP